ncbi:eIF2B alpha/beta/delta subunit family protein [Lactovum odontotermitis]
MRIIDVDTEAARSACTCETVSSFDDIVSQRVLGASNHIKMISDMIESIADECLEKGCDFEETRSRIWKLASYFVQTRGEASQAISNAIYLMLHGIDELVASDPLSKNIAAIIQTKDQYLAESKKNVETAVSFAVNLSENFEHLFIYDYSSSVEKFIKKLPSKKHIYIAESRCINGGAPFIESLKASGHTLHFFPDAACMYYLKKCEAVFMGAETIYPDGTGFNTTGSDMVGLICDYLKLPLYFITTLVKLDFRPLSGRAKNLVVNNLEDVLKEDLSSDYGKFDIDFTCPELIAVPASHIKGYITERGIIPAAQLYDIAIDYQKYLKGGTYV